MQVFKPEEDLLCVNFVSYDPRNTYIAEVLMLGIPPSQARVLFDKSKSTKIGKKATLRTSNTT